MKKILNNFGFSLVELLIVMGIMGIVLAVMYSGFNTLLKTSMVTRKMVKTESDIVNTVWPLFKEIESAGFGVPTISNCTPAVAIATGGALQVHSTAAGDAKGAGTSSYISGTSCSVTGLTGGDYVVIINPATKEIINYDNVKSSADALVTCSSSSDGKVAYWMPSGPGPLPCYEARFALRSYTSGTAPAMCASGTNQLSRSVSTTAGSTSYQPMLDCVLDFSYKFGCINKTTGSLTWRSDTSCSSSEGDLRLVRVGIVLQESPRTESQVAATLTMFEDTGSTTTINLTSEQRFYKWRIAERTIVLRNLE